MLEQLLAEIRSGGTLETTALAARLGTSPQMVAVMLEHLQRAGYIQSYQSCDGGCGGCGLKADCQKTSSVNLLKLWQTQQFQI